MAPECDEQTVRHVAQLARLALTDEEAAESAVHLSRVLTYMELLNELDTTDVVETAHPLDAVNVMRDDVVQTPVSCEAALSNAPVRSGDCFSVPRVLEQGDA